MNFCQTKKAHTYNTKRSTQKSSRGWSRLIKSEDSLLEELIRWIMGQLIKEVNSTTLLRDEGWDILIFPSLGKKEIGVQ